MEDKYETRDKQKKYNVIDYYENLIKYKQTQISKGLMELTNANVHGSGKACFAFMASRASSAATLPQYRAEQALQLRFFVKLNMETQEVGTLLG